MTIKAVDLFCGVGGLTYGLQKAGIPVVAGIDIDEQLGKLLADPRLRAKGYDYSNVMCFCKMNYTVTPSVTNGYSSVDWEDPNIIECLRTSLHIDDKTYPEYNEIRRS